MFASCSSRKRSNLVKILDISSISRYFTRLIRWVMNSLEHLWTSFSGSISYCLVQCFTYNRIKVKSDGVSLHSCLFPWLYFEVILIFKTKKGTLCVEWKCDLGQKLRSKRFWFNIFRMPQSRTLIFFSIDEVKPLIDTGTNTLSIYKIDYAS